MRVKGVKCRAGFWFAAYALVMLCVVRDSTIASPAQVF